LGQLHQDKPGHGSVITLRPGTTWTEETIWSPGDTPGFGEKADLRAVANSTDQGDPTSA
jgi:hypothetical protein